MNENDELHELGRAVKERRDLQNRLACIKNKLGRCQEAFRKAQQVAQHPHKLPSDLHDLPDREEFISLVKSWNKTSIRIKEIDDLLNT